MRVDVAVIGAGIQGSSVAFRLAQAGAKVAVLERGIPGAEASSAAAGILSPGVGAVEPGPFHALCRASLERYPSFVREVEALSGMSIGFRALGTLEGALDETHAKVLAGRAEKMLRHGLPAEGLVRAKLAILAPGPPLLSRVVFSGHGYVVPRADGRILCGSTMEEVGFEKAVTAGGLRHVLDVAMSIAPALERSQVVETWSNFRPASPDGEPILGAGTVPGLFYATGHTRNGILLAPITADAIAAAILGRSAPMDLSPFSPARLPGILGRKG